MSSANTQAEEKYEYSVFAIPRITINVKYYHNQLRELARDGWEIYATDTSYVPFGCSVYFIKRIKKGGSL